MKTLTRARSALGTSTELVTALARNGRWWLIPLVGVMGVCALLLGVVTVIEYAAPFVYTIF
jgi:hypothetical protein